MRLQDLYNPRHVYEGFFECYFIRPFIHHYADFRSGESAGSCVKSLLAWVIITLGVVGIMLGQVGIIGPEAGVTAAWIVCGIWMAASVVPIVALLARAAHGAPEHPVRHRMLGVDVLLGASCVLFFVLGLMMLITTLDSGELNPNARIYDEPDTTQVEEEEYVKEEPIFTYQDEAAEVEEPAIDTMVELTEPDLVAPEESFDPTIEYPVEDSI